MDNNHKPDIKVMFQPGGKSNFSLGWGNDEIKKKKKVKKTDEEIEEERRIEAERKLQNEKTFKDNKKEEYGKNVKTSVKVHAPPGGKSNFTLG